MRYLAVTFPNSNKYYYYKTHLNLIGGGIYKIVADNCTTYDSPVKIEGFYKAKPVFDNIREITSAKLISAPNRPDGNIKRIYVNEKKKTTVILWKDGTKTKVKCHPEDNFDIEKGIAMCFMKKAFNNRGCYNEILKKSTSEDINE